MGENEIVEVSSSVYSAPQCRVIEMVFGKPLLDSFYFPPIPLSYFDRYETYLFAFVNCSGGYIGRL